MAPQMGGRPAKPSKLSPTAFDEWWRARIEKEEGRSPEAIMRSKQRRDCGKGLVTGFVIPGDHLTGAAAIVKGQPTAPAAPAAPAAGAVSSSSQAGRASKAGSVASVARTAATGAQARAPGNKAGSVVGQSHASYPKTPSFSAAGKSATDSIIMQRLSTLEQELLRERARREAAERQMKDLISVAATQHEL